MGVVFITCHDYTAVRKVDFHFWAKNLEQRKIKSYFITVGLSSLTDLKPSDRRDFSKPYNSWVSISPWLSKFVWRPPFHPANFGPAWLNAITAPIIGLYPYFFPQKALNEIKNATLFVIENGAGLMLVPLLKKHFPKASFVYTVSDRLQTLNVHPIIYSAEKTALPSFNLIRVPSATMMSDYTGHKNVRYIPPGIDKSQFDDPMPSPYTHDKNVISVGDMLFDEQSVGILADAFPDWTFHLFGKGAKLSSPKKNVKEYGEKPFNDIVPYIKYADAGLAPYRPAPDVEYISQSSLKIRQYTYCGLPIIAPHFANTGKDYIMTYTPADKGSLVNAMNKAIVHGRIESAKTDILSWEEVIEQMRSAA